MFEHFHVESEELLILLKDIYISKLFAIDHLTSRLLKDALFINRSIYIYIIPIFQVNKMSYSMERSYYYNITSAYIIDPFNYCPYKVK